MKMKAHSFLPLLGCALWLLPAEVAAQDHIDQTFSVPAESVVEIVNPLGRVTVKAWNRSEVRVVGRRRSPAVTMHLEQTANRVHVHTHEVDARTPASQRLVNYEIWAPSDTHLQAKLETGSLHVENFNQDITVETVAADVTLRRISGRATVETMNGSIQAEGCSGKLEAKSISGTLRILDPRIHYLVAETTSGDIYYSGELLRGGSYRFTNHKGAIDLALPADASFDLNANTTKGRVMNEFPLVPHTHGRVPPRSYGQGLLGTSQSGGAMVRVTSFSGTIRIRKR